MPPSCVDLLMILDWEGTSVHFAFTIQPCGTDMWLWFQSVLVSACPAVSFPFLALSSPRRGDFLQETSASGQGEETSGGEAKRNAATAEALASPKPHNTSLLPFLPLPSAIPCHRCSAPFSGYGSRVTNSFEDVRVADRRKATTWVWRRTGRARRL